MATIGLSVALIAALAALLYGAYEIYNFGK